MQKTESKINKIWHAMKPEDEPFTTEEIAKKMGLPRLKITTQISHILRGNLLWSEKRKVLIDGKIRRISFYHLTKKGKESIGKNLKIINKELIVDGDPTPKRKTIQKKDLCACCGITKIKKGNRFLCEYCFKNDGYGYKDKLSYIGRTKKRQRSAYFVCREFDKIKRVGDTLKALL